MSRTLILIFHRDLAGSHANATLAEAVTDIRGVEIVDMQARYPDGRIDMMSDGAVEAAGLLEADRIVLQFPIHWYSTPALLKAWQDAVLTRMYYLNGDSEGARLVGTPIMLAITAGNDPGAYTREGQNYYSVDEILIPLKATAYRCGLPWHDPFIVYRADTLEAATRDDAARGYRRAIERFIGG